MKAHSHTTSLLKGASNRKIYVVLDILDQEDDGFEQKSMRLLQNLDNLLLKAENEAYS